MSELFLDTWVKFQLLRKGHETEGRVIIPKDEYMIVAEDADYYFLAPSIPLMGLQEAQYKNKDLV